MNSIAKLDALAKDASTLSAICEAYARLSLTSRKYLLDALVEFQDVPARPQPKQPAVPVPPKSKRRKRVGVLEQVKVESVLAVLRKGSISRIDLAREVCGMATARNVCRISQHLSTLRAQGLAKPVGLGVWSATPQLQVAS